MRARIPILVVVLVLSACGSDGGATTTVDPADTPSSSTSVTVETSSTTTTEAPASSTSSTTTTAGPVETLGPAPGSLWSVVGVSHDDVLSVRAAPDRASRVVGELEPTASDVEASGAAFLSGSMIWWEVDADGIEGYAASRYLSTLGSTDDVTASVIAANDGERPSAASMEELVAAVLELQTHDDAVVVVAPSVVGAIGECTVDVFVDGDDSIRGERLVVFGQRDGSTGPFSLYAVESTSVCWRGVDAGGLCV